MTEGADWSTDMEAAPRDGTTIEVLTVHSNARYCTGVAHAIGDGWVAIQQAAWSDFNRGGWVWHGMVGEHIAWRPLQPVSGGHDDIPIAIVADFMKRVGWTRSR